METANVPATPSVRETLLGFIGKAPKYRDVPLGDGDGTVRVAVMSGGDRDRFERLYNETKGTNQRALLLAFAVVDQDNRRVFTEADISEIARIPSDIIDAAFKAAWKLNKLGEDEVKEAEKNS